jgi:hypothetical protein
LEDVLGTTLKTKKLFTGPWGISLGNHWSYNKEDLALELMKTSQDYDALIRAWYLENYKVQRTTISHLHSSQCPCGCYIHGKIYPECSITYDKRNALNARAIHIGATVMNNPSIVPDSYHKFVHLFHPKELEKLPDSQDCYHQSELLCPEDMF